MSGKPKALDLFCGGGGAALGLIQAGYDVYGVDNNPRHWKVYPGRFVHGDALNPPFRLADFDLVWASPPCQRYSRFGSRATRHLRPDLVEPTRNLLHGHWRTVIENVPGAPIRPDVILTGPMFGLGVLRRRHFELSWWPGLLPHVPSRTDGPAVTVTTHSSYSTKAAALEAMGIDLPMTARQVGEAVPPAYSRFIGELALAA